MRITKPIYRKQKGNASGGKSGVARSILGKREGMQWQYDSAPVSWSSAASSGNSILWRRTTNDGARIKVQKIARAGEGVLPLRLTSVAKNIETEEEEGTIELFLESAWVTVMAGPFPGELWYSPHLKARYDAQATEPAFLDYMFLPGPLFDIRPYTPWMEDDIVWLADPDPPPEGHEDDTIDLVKNRHNHSSRLGLFTRCLQGANTNPSTFLDALAPASTTGFTYAMHVTPTLDYYLLKITTTSIKRAKLLFSDVGDELLAMLQQWKDYTRIDRWSDADKLYRLYEQYLFAQAYDVGTWELLKTFDNPVEGWAPYGGWNADWNGDHLVHVTAEQDPASPYSYNIDGIRFRLYRIDVTDVDATLTEVENTLGTPVKEITKIFHPNTTEPFGRMEYWYFMDRHQEYTQDVTSNFPIAAAYNEVDGLDDTYFVIRYRHDARDYRAPVNYNAYLWSLGQLCAKAAADNDASGAGNSTGPFSTAAGFNYTTDGFYVSNPVELEADLHLEKSWYSADSVYEVRINVEEGATADPVCIASGSILGSWACDTGTPYWPDIWNSLDTCCGADWYTAGKAHSITCGNVTYTNDFFAQRNMLLHTAMMFNFGDPSSYRIISLLYDRRSSMTRNVYLYEDGPIWWTGTSNGLYWQHGIRTCVLPSLANHWSTCDSYAPGYVPPPCEHGCSMSNPTHTQPIVSQSWYDYTIKDYLVTPKRVVELQNYVMPDTEYIADGMGKYQHIWDLTMYGTGINLNPYLEWFTWCRDPVQNYMASGDLISEEVSTDMTTMPDPEDHLGFLTMPIGGA